MNTHKIFWIVILTLSVSGCGFGLFSKREEPIQVITKPIERTPLNLENPPPLRLRPIEWIVVTPENWEEVFRQMQSKDQNLVLFGLTSDGYQNLALTIAEIRNLINTQKIIIGKYREYYEPRVSGKQD
jgi:hypothetical protein